MFAFEKTEQVFTFAELSDSAKRIAANNYAESLYMLDVMQESCDSAKHVADVLGMTVRWPLCSDYGDIPTIEFGEFTASAKSIDIDSISDGLYVGEGAKMIFARHYDALIKAEEIADRFDEQSYWAISHAETLERDFAFEHNISWTKLVEFTYFDLDVLKPEIVNQINEISKAREKARRLDRLANDALETFEKFYVRIAHDCVESAYYDVESEYMQYFDTDYYNELFDPHYGYEPDNIPLFYDDGSISDYTLQDAIDQLGFSI